MTIGENGFFYFAPHLLVLEIEEPLGFSDPLVLLAQFVEFAEHLMMFIRRSFLQSNQVIA